MSVCVAALPERAVDCAVRLSCAQAMLGAIYGASTGGMFLIGYALKLQASHLQIGLMSTIPMLCVVAQLAAAAMVERGTSRRKLTLWAALSNVLGWVMVILIPYALPEAAQQLRIGMLIATITLVTLFGHLSNNARASWVGDLIPDSRRGRFFGHLTLYGGLIGTLFAVIEGLFLDWTKVMGIGAFGCLFGFGMLFGFANAILFVPQPDVPLAREEHAAVPFGAMVRATFSNREMRRLLIYDTLRWGSTIAAPFYNTYMLEKLNMPFLGVGLVNAAVILTMLISGPFWGRMVGRYGCRPVLIACTFFVAPVPWLWIWMTRPALVYWVVGPVNLIQGFAVGGISVGIQTLMYKVMPPAGRSVQFAIYSMIVILFSAAMPAVGGMLPQWLHAMGNAIAGPQWLRSMLLAADLRWTFYVASFFFVASAIAARFIRERGSRRTGQMLRELPGHVYAGGVEA